MHLLELVYVPAIRLFQSLKAMNADTVTASNGPTMKYHRRVALAENKKQNKKKNKNKKAPSYYGSTENEGRKQNKVVFC